MPKFRLNPSKSKPDADDERDLPEKFKNSGGPPEKVHGECTLCRFEKQLDYHHWDYENDIGCRLCRSCHEYIHEPIGAQPSETPGNEWVDTALSRLVERYAEYHEWVTADRIIDQFKIPRKHHPAVKSFVPQLSDTDQSGTAESDKR